MFQSTFPRRERRTAGRYTGEDDPVSIHVPAKGTTLNRRMLVKKMTLFQSTFPQRERPVDYEEWKGTKWFQSTFPRRERHPEIESTEYQHGVSIHVPAKGTTTCLEILFRVSGSFNPRSREGNDRSHTRFQSIYCGFNPRSHKGNDASAVYVLAGNSVSIHVPTRGTTCTVSGC